MANTIVIPLAKSSIDHLDLRMTLRSIEKNIKNFSNIVIVGSLPKWIKNVDNIDFNDIPDPKYKEKNILRKIQACCISGKVSENFFFTNDDIVFLKECDATKYPYLHKGEILPVGKKYAPNSYRISLKRTKNLLLNRGMSVDNYDIHKPIIYNKKKFLTTFDIGDINFETPYGYVIKSLYANFNKVKGEYSEDLKIQKKKSPRELKWILESADTVSFNDSAFMFGLDEIIEEIFPEKSIFEA